MLIVIEAHDDGYDRPIEIYEHCAETMQEIKKAIEDKWLAEFEDEDMNHWAAQLENQYGGTNWTFKLLEGTWTRHLK